MHKLTLTAVLATALAGVLIAPATAAFDSQFDVISKLKNGRVTDAGYVFYEKLVDPANPKDKVGSDAGVCRQTGPKSAYCRVTYTLGGEIGGHGTIRAAGHLNAAKGDHRIEITGGSGAFDGAAGKVLLLPSEVGSKYGLQRFSLVR